MVHLKPSFRLFHYQHKTTSVLSLPVILTDDQDVVELFHAVNLRKQLVDHGVVHARAAGACSSLLADGVQLIKDDDMQATVCSQLGEDDLKKKKKIINTILSIQSKVAATSHGAHLTLFCSSSASANSLRMLASDSPTYLLRISGPLTTFGSRALSILPICLAISVLPQPGGPNSRIPFTCLHPGATKCPRNRKRETQTVVRGRTSNMDGMMQ